MSNDVYLEYQDTSKTLIVTDSGRELLKTYETLQQACEAYSPDEDFCVTIRIRAWSLVKR